MTPLDAEGCINDPTLFASYLLPRQAQSHKGSYGDVQILGGAQGMAGAAILASRSALMCGAGRVFVGFLESPPAYDSLHPELMCRSAESLDCHTGTVVLGPGLGLSSAALTLLRRALGSSLTANSPLVVDADGLNLLAAHPELLDLFLPRVRPAILTPHPLEAARLLACTTQDIQQNRLLAARTLAIQTQSIIVLKGAGSIIARPDGHCAINPTGNAGLATAGTGDVLAGVCGALQAQGWPAWEAALAAVWLHGKAADILVQAGVGPVGLTASELPPALRQALNQLISAEIS